MNRRNVMDYLMSRRDGRNPYGSRGGYVDSRRDYGYGYDRNYSRNDYAERYLRDYNSTANSQQEYDRRDRNYEQPSRRDMGSYYPFNVAGQFGRYDGHYPMPMMHDYRRDYNYDTVGDYGETLSKDELKSWNKKLMREIDDKEKSFFTKENISHKAEQMGINMHGFNEEELATATLMMYTDYSKALKPYLGSNMDIYIAMAKEFLVDPDASVKGGEKLAVYHDCIVEDNE